MHKTIFIAQDRPFCLCLAILNGKNTLSIIVPEPHKKIFRGEKFLGTTIG
jgi:hypothetical protein